MLTDDEKRERVAEARKAQRAVYLATDEHVAEDLSRIIRGLADALEGTLTEPEWEWALRAVGGDEPFSDVYESRENLADCENGIAWQPEELVRRRKAGPWLLVEGGSNGA